MALPVMLAVSFLVADGRRAGRMAARGHPRAAPRGGTTTSSNRHSATWRPSVANDRPTGTHRGTPKRRPRASRRSGSHPSDPAHRAMTEGRGSTRPFGDRLGTLPSPGGRCRRPDAASHPVRAGVRSCRVRVRHARARRQGRRFASRTRRHVQSGPRRVTHVAQHPRLRQANRSHVAARSVTARASSVFPSPSSRPVSTRSVGRRTQPRTASSHVTGTRSLSSRLPALRPRRPSVPVVDPVLAAFAIADAASVTPAPSPSVTAPCRRGDGERWHRRPPHPRRGARRGRHRRLAVPASRSR